MDDSLKNDILRHADILAVVSSYGIQCQKKGKSYVALCPFHDDHNPSMNVNPERGTFMCWSCHTGGDAITFVRKMESLGYLEALRKVAEIAGIQDPRLSSLIPERKEDPEITSLRKTIEDLLAYYRYAITTPEGERAGAYLLSRGIDEEAQAMIAAAYERAKRILAEHREEHRQVAELLIEKEVIFSDDLERILGKRPWSDEEEPQAAPDKTETPAAADGGAGNDADNNEGGRD